jgi:tripartite-type tricarboxylate transporter receptor subunit TctC
MSKLTRRHALIAPLALAGPFAPLRARAQPAAWKPGRPLRFLVPFTPGGSSDIMARLLAEPLGQRLGQPVIIENRAGAGGNIGTEIAAKAEPDGHTIALVTVGTGAINHALYRNMPYRPQDLAAVSNLCTVPNVLMVANSLPATSMQALVALVKAAPGHYNFGSSGIGTSLHLTGEMLKASQGLEMTHIAFRGAAQMLMEAAAGRVEILVDNLPSALPQIRDGRVRALAVTDTKRSPSLPEIPTTIEAGYPEIQAVAWFGVVAPARINPAALARLSAEIRSIVKEPSFRAKLAEQGAEPVGDTPEQFDAFIRAEIAKWGDVVRRANASAE